MQHQIVSRAEWLAARKALLAKEKELTRQRDRLAAERRELPWVKVEKASVFDGPDGKETLAELFDGRSQLIGQHFMFGPDWDRGCISCSFGADHIQGPLVHLEHHDVTCVAISRAPLAKLEAYRKRSVFALTCDGGQNHRQFGEHPCPPIAAGACAARSATRSWPSR
jgi:predicted dithiol-disulfide oxidoreductase (DUF899 family)